MDALYPDFFNECGVFLQCGVSGIIHLKAQLCRKTNAPQYSQSILLESLGRFAHTTDERTADILLSAKGVTESFGRMVGNGVHGEIPPQKVLLQIGSERNLVGMSAVSIVPVSAVGGDFVIGFVQNNGAGAVLNTCVKGVGK